MRVLKVLLTLAIGFVFSCSYGQEWGALSEISTESDYEAAKERFESYWAKRPYEKGNGYKPFKRWEYQWSEIIAEEGRLPNAGLKYDIFQSYLKENKISDDTRMDPWESLGPNSTTGGYAGTGRVNSVGFDPIDANTIYVGSAGGGLWKSTDGGDNWLPKTDFIGSIGVSGITIDPNDTDIIYIATGDGDASDNYSIGVLKSTDGGDTWAATGLSWITSSTRVIRNMVMDPNDANTILIASNVGVYKTSDAGATWENVRNGNFYDVDYKPGQNSTTFYAVTRTNVYKSSDSGETWTDKFSVPTSNRLSIAITADNANYLYVLSSGTSSGPNGNSGYNGVYRSTDSGETFTLMSSSPNLLTWSTDGSGDKGQGWYDLVIAADPDDANTIHVGGVNHWKSTNGGTSWTIKSHWAGSGGIFEVHADKHMLEFQDDNTLWEGNDGGIYKTTNGGNTWTDKTSNLVISQMYKIGVSENNTQIITGLQDNGTKRRNNAGVWDDSFGGDGMDCAISAVDANIMYGESQNGGINKSNNGGVSWTGISGSLPKGAWVTPIVSDHFEANTVYTAMKNVYKSTNQGGAWEIISDELTGSNMTRLDVSHQNSDFIIAGSYNQMYGTKDGGENWTQMSLPVNVSMVKISKTNVNTLYATGANFANGSKVYKSTDYGLTWVNISGSLPNIPANCIAIHDDGDETLYVGMDVGVYYRGASDADWTLLNNALPNVKISELEIKESDGRLYAATYGRGVWRTETINSTIDCATPVNLRLADNDITSMTFAWDAPLLGAVDDYEFALTESNTPPASGSMTNALEAEATGLISGKNYYFHLKTDCTNNASSWITYGPVQVELNCGSEAYDTGGSTGYYSDNENTVWTICPKIGKTDLTLTFSTFNVEAGYDVLYIHNGEDTSSPLFAGGAASMQNSFPIGGFTGTTVPGPFTSTDESGCITLNFKSDGSVTMPGWIFDVSCNDDLSCQDPTNLTIGEVGSSTAELLWDLPFTIPDNGYYYIVTQSPIPPANGGELTTLLTATATGLNPNTDYYAHIRSSCTEDDSDWITSEKFTTVYGCDVTLYDSGGANQQYSNGENIQWKICKENPISDLVLTFTDFAIEANWDALYIHDGPDTNSPLFAGGANSMNGSFPLGGFTGSNIPGPFASTDPSGCITIQFLSDGYVEDDGWEFSTSCDVNCTTEVSNLNATGYGSLVDAIACAEEGTLITANLSISGDTIMISQTLVINKEVGISPSVASSFYLGSNQNIPIINVNAQGEVILNNIKVLGSNTYNGASIINSGILELENVDIVKGQSSPSSSSAILNTGTIRVSGNTNIKEN